MRQAENVVKICGILAESDLKYGSFVKNGETVETVGGKIKVLVERPEGDLMIPVDLFSTKFTKAGNINPSYESIENAMKNFYSIAACGSKQGADRIRISGTLYSNDFPNKSGQMVSSIRVRGSFISKVTGAFEPEASFSLEFVVSNINHTVDVNGEELDPPRLEVGIIVPQYTAPGAAPNVDVMKLIASNPNVINAIENYWETNLTYKANGRLNFTSTTKEVEIPVDFGEPKREIKTVVLNDLVITGGSQSPLDDGIGFDLDEIKAGLAARKIRLNDLKAGKGRQNKKTPAPTSGISKEALDLGF